ncbi:unnamed protein product [Penicillium manginii]
MCSSDVFLAVLAILFPPIAGTLTILAPPSVWIKAGICTADSIINIALCLLGYVPGLIHAWYIILKYPDPDYDNAYEPIPGGSSQRRDLENGRVTYYYVSNPPLQHPSQQRSYGATQQPPSNSNAPSGNQPSGNKAPNHPQEGAAGSSGQNAPPTYAEAVRGDNKIQTQD